MKILLINKYLYPKGGAEKSTFITGNILKYYGHDVNYWGMSHPLNPLYKYHDTFVSYVNFNNKNSISDNIRYSFKLIYSLESKRKINALLQYYKPDIVHMNNIYHQLSPSIIDELKKHNIPIVMSLRDFKMICPTYNMYNNYPCEKCIPSSYYKCFLYKCTKNSYMKSFINMMEMYIHHKVMHIYDNVSAYISPSMFLKNKLFESGFKQTIYHLPNCIDAKKFNPQYEHDENSIVYVGRITNEKGINTLIKAVSNLNVHLKIIGDGPQKKSIEQNVLSDDINNVQFMGYMHDDELYREIKASMFLVIPSEWYENNPRAVIEAFALGKPVLGADIGGIPELVQPMVTGLCFNSGDVSDLKDKIQFMVDNKHIIVEMGKNARKYVEEYLNTQHYYEQLMNIYYNVI